MEREHTPMEEPTKETEQLPEAPVSCHIDGYYKGFHVGITQRDPEKQEETFKLLSNAKSLIDLMEKDGWMPSWNIETSRAHKTNGGSVEKEPTKEDKENCQHNNTRELVVKKEGKNKGRTFISCNDCGGFVGWKK